MPETAIPESYQRLLDGPGMRIALWPQTNHDKEWGEERDVLVEKRAAANAKQFPAFAKLLTEDISQNKHD